MLIPLLAIPAMCIWTGHGLFQLVGPRRFQSEALTGVFLWGLSGMVALGWVALVAAEVGFFSATAIAAAGVLLGGVGWLVGRRRGVVVVLNRPQSHLKEIAFLLALTAVMSVLYLRPHEFIFGGADAGVYISLGANVSRTGSWLVRNPDLAEIPQDNYPMLFREHPPYYEPHYIHLPGFYVSDEGAGTIIPQFYPLHPVWLAIAHGLGGVWANLFMTPLWGMLGVLAFYFAVREAFDRRLAAVAAILLALTPTQIWFSRYPTSEVLTQFLLFSGLYAFARYIRHGEKWAAVLAGLALGQVMLARIDTYFLLGIPPIYAAYLCLQRRFDRRFWVFTGPMLVMSAHSIVHAVWQGWPYLHNVYFVGGSPVPKNLVILVGGLVLVTAASIVFGRIATRSPNLTARLRPIWRTSLSIAAVALVLLAAYAYFLRPMQADPNQGHSYWYGQSTIPDVEPYNLVRLGWYLTPLGLVLGVLGIALIVREKIDARTWLIIGIGVFFSILFIYCSFNNPHHVYVMRRYVPAVIPTFVIGTAYAILRLANWRQIGRVLALGLVVTQVGLMLCTNRVMIQQVDYQGSVSQFRSLSVQIPSDAIVLFSDVSPIGTAGVFGTPLAYIDGHTVLDLQEDRLNLDRLDELIEGWLIEGRPVIVVDRPSRVSGLCDRWRCRLLGTTRFNFSVLEASYEHLPISIILIQHSLDLYAVESVQP